MLNFSVLINNWLVDKEGLIFILIWLHECLDVKQGLLSLTSQFKHNTVQAKFYYENGINIILLAFYFACGEGILRSWFGLVFGFVHI